MSDCWGQYVSGGLYHDTPAPIVLTHRVKCVTYIHISNLYKCTEAWLGFNYLYAMKIGTASRTKRARKA